MGRSIAGNLRRGVSIPVIWLAIPALAAAAYYLLALIACAARRGHDLPRAVRELFPTSLSLF